MLVLEREEGQEIVIGGTVVVKVLRFRHGQRTRVALGISAPRAMSIVRPDAPSQQREGTDATRTH
jgi:sRNA-binding carbon storage regulator CsrA